MQEIFILRHAHAEDLENTLSKKDFDRRLTEEGIEKAKRLGFFFNKLNENIDLILSSPYLRAKETAEIFTNQIEPRPILKIVDFLSCSASSTEIAKGLLPFFSKNKVVLVGHAPDLEQFIGKLIGGNQIDLKKGALAKVHLNNSIELSGELEWLITPKLIKKVKLKNSTKPVSA